MAIKEDTSAAATTPGRAVHTPAQPPAGEAQEARPDTKKRGKTTLGERGPVLPVGLRAGDQLVKKMAIHPWRTREEKLLAKFKKPHTNIAQHVSMVLGTMCAEFGHHMWSLPERDRELNERRVAIGSAGMGDVFYAYCYLRKEVMGEIVNMNITCPSCAHKWLFPADLNTLEVVTAEHPDALLWEHVLRTPVSIRGKKVSKLRMGQASWNTMEMATAGTINDASAKIAALRGAIIGFDDDPTLIQAIESDLDELTKYDLESVIAKVDANHVGPKMALDGECPRCQRVFLAPIDWKYDSFFSNSSR